MASPKAKGRMINKDISDSSGFAELSPHAAVLFCMLIPHFNAHGKMNGGPGFIKDEVCPRIYYLTIKNIPKYLKEISDKTNVKWFVHDGRYWIHSLKFLTEHQTIKEDKLGSDLLPNYSRSSSDLVPPEVEGEVEVEEEVEEEGSGRPAAPSSTDASLPVNGLDPELKKILIDCPHLALISTGASSTFWDQVLAICEPYPQAGSAWLNMKIRQWNQWFQKNKHRRSKKRDALEERIMGWIVKDLEAMARKK